MGWTDDARAKKEERFEDIVFLLPNGVFGRGENGTKKKKGRAWARGTLCIMNYEIREGTDRTTEMGKPISKRPKYLMMGIVIMSRTRRRDEISWQMRERL